MIPSTQLVLARFAPRMQRQAGDILDFSTDEIRVMAGGKILAQFPYVSLKRLQYRHFPGSLSRTFQMLGGNLLQRREAVLSVRTEGGKEEFFLESDLEFRLGDLRNLFRGLYQQGIPLEEYSANGNRMFLLESAAGMDIEAAIQALAGKQSDATQDA